MNSDMSRYTITIYELIESKFNFGLDKYPIFDENYRTILNEAILNYYMFREIGVLNPVEFRFRLQARMSLIMRNKYNAMYSAKAKDFNPLYTMELYEDYSHNIKNDGTNTNNGETNFNTNSNNNTINSNVVNTKNSNKTNVTTNDTTNSSSNGRQINSIYPSDEFNEGDLSDNLYVASGSHTKGEENSTDVTEQNSDSTIEVDNTNNGTVNNTNVGTDKTVNVNNATNNNNMIETYSKKTYGSASALTFAHTMTQFKDYCEQFQLDQEVIDELKDLFMNCY